MRLHIFKCKPLKASALIYATEHTAIEKALKMPPRVIRWAMKRSPRLRMQPLTRFAFMRIEAAKAKRARKALRK